MLKLSIRANSAFTFLFVFFFVLMQGCAAPGSPDGTMPADAPVHAKSETISSFLTRRRLVMRRGEIR